MSLRWSPSPKAVKAIMQMSEERSLHGKQLVKAGNGDWESSEWREDNVELVVAELGPTNHFGHGRRGQELAVLSLSVQNWESFRRRQHPLGSKNNSKKGRKKKKERLLHTGSRPDLWYFYWRMLQMLQFYTCSKSLTSLFIK